MSEDTPGPSESGQKERSGSDRRGHVDRRRNVAPWAGDERRKANRRKAVDRRGLPHGVHYKTSEPLAVLYDWLNDHCYGRWSVGIDGAGEDPVKKSVKVLFEMEKDRNKFMETVVRG